MVMNALLNHDDLRRWRTCTRRFWLYRRGEPLASVDALADASADAPVVHGPAVEAALRASFPLADVIDAPTTPAEWNRAMRQTVDCLDSDRVAPEGWAILGACLTSEDRAQVRIDVLTCGERGLRLFKVRYATVGDDADVDAVALWTHVAARCGLRVQSVGLLLIDTDFIYPGHGCYAGLLREVDLAPVLGSRPVGAWLAAMQDCMRGPLPPASPGTHCTQSGGCEFVNDCQACASMLALQPDHPPTSLEVVGRELAAELRHEGHVTVLSVPLERLHNTRHRRAVRAILQDAPVLEPAVATLMQALATPRYYLRLDTIGFGVPLWAGTRPYQILPFQWTCDVQCVDGQLAHHGFLADEQGDPRRAFAHSLLQVLGSRGPIFAYNAGFERNRLRELAQHLDDLAPALEAVVERIVDLFQLARAHYYHPVMAGSWSFKSISRAVAPQVPVEFHHAQAVTARTAFALSFKRGLEVVTRQQLRAELQAHGLRETEVLRRMAALFDGAAGGQPV